MSTCWLQAGLGQGLVLTHSSLSHADAAWHLEKIIVKQTSTGEESIFDCNQWLSKKHEDGLLERELMVS